MRISPTEALKDFNGQQVTVQAVGLNADKSSDLAKSFQKGMVALGLVVAIGLAGVGVANHNADQAVQVKAQTQTIEQVIVAAANNPKIMDAVAIDMELSQRKSQVIFGDQGWHEPIIGSHLSNVGTVDALNDSASNNRDAQVKSKVNTLGRLTDGDEALSKLPADDQRAHEVIKANAEQGYANLDFNEYGRHIGKWALLNMSKEVINHSGVDKDKAHADLNNRTEEIRKENLKDRVDGYVASHRSTATPG